MENQYQLEEGQIVLCTVEKIIGTTVFVKIQEGGEGTITTSEISPGRIRNLRDYVVPNKKIVCKILSIRGDKIYLSLRRVKQNEKKELLDKISKEKSYRAILKTALGKEESEQTVEKITEKYSLIDFFESLKNDSKLLEKYTDKKNTEKILKILETKKEKPKEIKQIFKLSCSSSDGINVVKNIIEESCKEKGCNLSYISAGTYRISITGEDLKKTKSIINNTFNQIEKLSKKNKCTFAIQKS